MGINPVLSDVNTPQTWAGGTLKTIKVIGMNSRFSKNHKKIIGTKMAEKF